MYAETDSPSPPLMQRRLVWRHSFIVRLTHWINLLCFVFLLPSGLQIFNAYPHLHFGAYGADTDPALVSVSAEQHADGLRGYLRIGAVKITTTGLLGISSDAGVETARAFPAWLTLPSYLDLAAGRRWHLFFAWLLVVNGTVYLAHGLYSGHFRRDLLLSREQMKLRHLWHQLRDHACLHFPKGEEARRYNALQKMTYLLVVLLLLPLMVCTGLTMSPGMDAALPLLLDCFGGRASARTLHFIAAMLLVLFVAVHVTMVAASGPWNNLRSMLSGRYAIRTAEDAS
ncbi:cytochrome b/b6 domain-containing protein [Bradyrhizobium sp. HKCCYLS2038]|uniref:cytochrome b/b6 domain-containing protein n=1 Tax=unclassified Bradyrhizobium TaxID=2631580 RepID=UPI003EB911F3